MNFLLWIVFGGIAGWVASLIMHTDAQQGLLLNIIVGIVGASIGGWVVGLAGMDVTSGINLYSFGVAILGAIILIALVRVVRRV